MTTPDTPSYWLEGFAKLSPLTLPCPGFRNDEWRGIHAATKLFIETRASEAAGMGWTGIDLFSVHETVGAANVSACGALMMGTTTAPAEEITPTYIRFGRSRYFKMKMQATVLVWRFGAEG